MEDNIITIVVVIDVTIRQCMEYNIIIIISLHSLVDVIYNRTIYGIQYNYNYYSC